MTAAAKIRGPTLTRDFLRGLDGRLVGPTPCQPVRGLGANRSAATDRATCQRSRNPELPGRSSQSHFSHGDHRIDRDPLNLPEVVIDSFVTNDELGVLIRPSIRRVLAGRWVARLAKLRRDRQTRPELDLGVPPVCAPSAISRHPWHTRPAWLGGSSLAMRAGMRQAGIEPAT